MAGPKIGGGSGSGGAAYVRPDTRPHIDTIEDVWPGCYGIARRYSRLKDYSKMRAAALRDLRMRIIWVTHELKMEVEPGYIDEVANDLIDKADTDGVRYV